MVINGRLQLDQLVVDLYALVDLEPVRVVEVSQLLFVVRLLGVLNRKHLHEEVGGVAPPWHVELQSAEVLHRLARVALEHCESVRHQDQPVKVEKGLRTRRVNCRQDCLSLLSCKVVKKFAN